MATKAVMATSEVIAPTRASRAAGAAMAPRAAAVLWLGARAEVARGATYSS